MLQSVKAIRDKWGRLLVGCQYPQHATRFFGMARICHFVAAGCILRGSMAIHDRYPNSNKDRFGWVGRTAGHAMAGDRRRRQGGFRVSPRLPPFPEAVGEGATESNIAIRDDA